VTEPDVLATYRMDQSQGTGAGMPLVAVRAESTRHVQAVLRTANRFRVPVVTRGAGSGLAGGAMAVDGCIVLSTERMRSVHVDPASRTAVVQPGLLNVEVKAAAERHGLWYPPDPSSYEISSIGGNVATNAGGLCCVKYGVTGNYVLGMEVVLADGTAVRLGGPTLKNVAGLQLDKLFVGSEGCLGVITEITLRLVARPEAPHTLVASMPTLEAAAAAVLEITAACRPSLLELMDRTTIHAVDDYLHMGLDRDAGAMLLAQSDLGGSAAVREMEQIADACAGNGAKDVFRTDDAAEGELFLSARRASLPATHRLGSVYLEDIGVALPDLPKLINGISAIGAQTGTTIATVAHAGDGNAHPVVVYDAADPESEAAARRAFSLILELAISLGGTITGEHGVGRLKTPWLEQQLGSDAMALTRRIKLALDPEQILNPGVILP
jgi:glycolate oxidase